jgi:hypothetical protein
MGVRRAQTESKPGSIEALASSLGHGSATVTYFDRVVVNKGRNGGSKASHRRPPNAMTAPPAKTAATGKVAADGQHRHGA